MNIVLRSLPALLKESKKATQFPETLILKTRSDHKHYQWNLSNIIKTLAEGFFAQFKLKG